MKDRAILIDRKTAKPIAQNARPFTFLLWPNVRISSLVKWTPATKLDEGFFTATRCGMVQAYVGQKLLKRDILRVFTMSDL